MTCKSWNNIDLSKMNYGKLNNTQKHLKAMIEAYRNCDDPIVKYSFHYDFFNILFNDVDDGVILGVRSCDTFDFDNPTKIKIGSTIFTGQIKDKFLYVARGKNDSIYLSCHDIEKIDVLLKQIDNYLIIDDCNAKIQNAKEEIERLKQIE